MATCTYPWENISDPVMAEARACLQAIIMADDMGFQDICIEGDALTIICKLNFAEEDRSCISNLIKEIKGRACTKGGQQSCSCGGEGRRALRAYSILDRGGVVYGGDPDKSREEKWHSWRLDREVESGLCGVCLPEELAILKEIVVLEGLILGEN
ncbi:hypothetical protein Goklo_024635, partial [Gossypium klotzschianum]|nr:hypothetical protein [Gossypium klotzschianum]